jgi:hypothetical protein
MLGVKKHSLKHKPKISRYFFLLGIADLVAFENMSLVPCYGARKF